MNNNLTIRDGKEAKDLSVLVVNVAQVLVQNGAEIYRAEDTATRICSAFSDIKNVNAYATYNIVMVSFNYKDEDIITMRRIKSYSFDLNKVALINNFSRRFVKGEISIIESFGIVHEIGYGKFQKLKNYLLFGSLGSALLIFIFGGNWQDFIVTLFAAFAGIFALFKVAEISFSFFFNNIAGAFAAALVAVLSIKLGIGSNVDIVITGAMIPLLPGIYFTNAVRDFMSGDVSSGLYGLTQSILVAAGMALGVSLVLYFYY
ncbi:threonine/serine ThrE exporter family protein [Miniphocaeibacter massiliensis]|uniref:threonine/serine ThrE exporter family protein n=1 Tax=Miniphocaeibacter massiliensis TaxID=2041841 RepID=UPI000C08C8CE|nr:threonine/serine exporter family protein [Miniphocaeibacter massiliensis]